MTPRVTTASIASLSHVQLQTYDEQAFQAALEFYTALGFQTVKHSQSHRETVSLKESAWLHLFPSTSSFPGAESNPLTIRLSLLQPPADSQTPRESSSPLAEQLCFSTTDIQNLETFLHQQGCAVQHWDVTPGQSLATGDADLATVLRSPSHGAWIELTTQDPLGTPLVFTNKQGPFSTVTRPFQSTTTAEEPESVFHTAVPSHDGATTPAPCGDRVRRIGVLTSGGDSPGMNPAVRAVVRTAIARDCVPYAIHDGYQGLVDGGNKIQRMEWQDVHSYLIAGGTNIGTARCMAFKTHEGRLRAAKNLITHGIDSLVVIGGDGSLTGADIFRAEWPSLVEELEKEGEISKSTADNHRHLTIVGLVGSIDNDMAATDMTIGAVSSVHRICESVDAISSTAISHSRAFVIEVMGRHCGWLALMAGICTGADWLFVPERPPHGDDWKEQLCQTLRMHRHMGKRKSIIIVSEGAIDSELRPIKVDGIKDLLCERLHLDCRVTQLGHVQRGGSPCAYDRLLATVQGAEAVEAVLRSSPSTPSPMIGTRSNQITCQPLMAAVELTHNISKAIAKKDFQTAMELRSADFADVFDAFVSTSVMNPAIMASPSDESADLHTAPPPMGMCAPVSTVDPKYSLRIGVIHVGAPAGGMSAATRAIVRYALNRGHTPLAINNGFPGLIRGDLTEMSWMDVDGWSVQGGSRLGTNRDQPNLDLGMVAFQLQKHNIQSLVLVGGFEAYTALMTLYRQRAAYPAFCIPMVLIPATISNNVPGTDHSLGSDTSLNALVEACDRIKQSASASRRRVFVVETQGGNCGYLAAVGGLITGAVASYIPERGVKLADIQRDVQHIRHRFIEAKNSGLGLIILRNEKSSATYTTDVLSAIVKEEGEGLYDSKTSVLGHLLQGGTPSPLDRYRATLLGVKCVQWAEQLAWDTIKEQDQQG
ncbi:6-phosphofructokinase, alpha subunit, partial [Dispira parvispora]